MRKAFLLVLILISSVMILIQFASKPLIEALHLQPKAGVRVEANEVAKVFLNQVEVGETPYQQENLNPEEYLIELKSNKGSWQGFVELHSGTLTVVNRELKDKKALSSGEVITLEKGSGLIVTANPKGAEVEIDGKNYGKTPLKIDELRSGEHTFLISLPNFLKRTIRASLTSGYQMTLNVDLAATEVDLTQINTTPLSSSSQGVVKRTPTGFLRVRSGATVTSSEVARVLPGALVTILEELPGWLKVRLSDDKEGYVSSAYIEKK